jgi:hypothetical protein
MSLKYTELCEQSIKNMYQELENERFEEITDATSSG